ncbi:cubilin-like [Amphibalanus amphitrite]|uniref:cubilin-like n=1 Tax=Amphibalanus amphitrite TaxID=1232801 RepID=UPI001C9159BD|nr:cubilin-like [Amphibalanus amphitrite]
MRPSQQLVCLLAVALTAVAAATITSKDASMQRVDNSAEAMTPDRQHSAIAAQQVIEQRSLDDATLLACYDGQGYKPLPAGVYYIQSPNYRPGNPGNYTNNYECMYKFKAADNKSKLRIDCFFFQLEGDMPDCVTKDYLYFQTEDLFAAYCGKNIPKTMLSRYVYAFFHTNSEITDKGFFCTIMSKEALAGSGGLQCGKHNLAPGTYSLLSQNYPDNYGTNIYCKWELVASDPSNTVDFSCSSFDMISWDNSCEWDWMKVDGVRHCNNNKPAPQQFTGGVTVEYSTPDLPHKTRKGFKCTVTVK